MDQTKVRKKRSKGHTVEYRRGLTVDVLTWDGSTYRDKAGKEYIEGSVHGYKVYHLKKAILCTGMKSYVGICDKSKKHRSHCDAIPRSKKCECGGTFIFEDTTIKMAQVKRSPNKPYTGKGKKRKGK